jgi:hypothetical protein
MIKDIFFYSLLLLFFSGCASPFLQKEYVLTLDHSNDNAARIVFYEKTYDFSNMDNVRQTTRSIVKIGLASKSIPGILDVDDNSIIKLESYNARILGGGKVKESFSKSDLNKYSLTSAAAISSSSVYFLPVTNITKPGDLIETVSVHTYTLPELGVNFREPADLAPDTEYRFKVIMPEEYEISYKVINNLPPPEVNILENNSKEYIFKGTSDQQSADKNIFSKKDHRPGALITYPSKEKNGYNWDTFGSWYDKLFRSKAKADVKLKSTVEKIISGLVSDQQKIEAIVKFCQQNIRYEQVYFDLGEIIPNDCNSVLERGYGDCKDYSVLIYTMADIAGIKTYPALCFRGRGYGSMEDIAVSQFNHVIIYYNNGSKDYWIDGTNRSSVFGITTSDLINQAALIIDENNCRVKQIDASGDNHIKLTGSLKRSKNDLIGELQFYISGQYAADFHYFNYVLNRKDLTNLIQNWINENISTKMLMHNISGEQYGDMFTIKTRCTIPNALTSIESYYYCSVLQIFPSIIAQLPSDYKNIFYYPLINKVEIDIELPELSLAEEDVQKSFYLRNNWSLNPGPFSINNKTEFINKLKETRESLNIKYKLREKN